MTFSAPFISRIVLIGSAVLLAFSISSCKKTNVRKHIDGTWTLESYTADNNAAKDVIDATYIFEKCSKSNNSDFACDVEVTFVSQQGGQQVSRTNDYTYAVLADGAEVSIDGVIYEVKWQTNRMVLRNQDLTTGELIKLLRADD